jgi:hypothetical protein
MRFIYHCAPQYYGHEVRRWLSGNYPGRSIGRGREAPVSWPARSPDLNPLYFLLWGIKLIKTKVCASAVETIEELWHQIQQFASEIKNTPEISERSILPYSLKIKLCVHEHEGHFEHLL